ncbi:cytochrome P450 [Lentzea tibetensis]|uniref:Cytochrome P450 n=1 Tax=Lentzea tibetensis TaxID=2591470 RepID=A0A563EHC0_9PSEU|nr:cytochrome P450 [Lentzea tibetensis]TWP46001.1 cytochrome P450 [Lentzea tibetensis]
MDHIPPTVSGARPVIGHGAEFFSAPERLIWRGYTEHGGLFSLSLPGVRSVVLLGAERNRFFYSETDKALSIRAAYPFFKRMFSPEFYVFAGVEEYHRQREIVVPRFQGRQLESYVAAMERETERFIDGLGTEGEFDLVDELGPLVMRIAARCFLGADFASRMDRDFFEEFRRFSGGMGFLLPGWLPLPRLVRSRRSRDRLRAVLGDMIRERRRNPVRPVDFLQTLAESRYSDGEPVPDLVLVNLVLLLTWAGHETTAGHISWAVADLLGSPDDLLRVRAESELAVAGGSIELADTKVLAHLDNCLHESERLHPVAYIQARKAAEDFEMDGYRVPKGTLVFSCPAVSHRLPDEHARPDSYWPDRYARGREGKQERQSLIGFGGGVHRCTGVHFAYLEMKVILARLFTRFDFDLLDGAPKPVRGMKTKWPESPCRVRYRARSRSGKALSSTDLPPIGLGQLA